MNSYTGLHDNARGMGIISVKINWLIAMECIRASVSKSRSCSIFRRQRPYENRMELKNLKGGSDLSAGAEYQSPKNLVYGSISIICLIINTSVGTIIRFMVSRLSVEYGSFLKKLICDLYFIKAFVSRFNNAALKFLLKSIKIKYRYLLSCRN